jgi:prepilin-type processing-associated H-X9-DG protein
VFVQYLSIGWVQQGLKAWGWWGPSEGRRSIGHVTMSACVPINYQVPFTPATAASANPPVTDGVSLAHYGDLRTCAFGSNHPGGANFVLVDGSCTFLPETMSLDVLKSLATRHGAEKGPLTSDR